MTKSWKTTVAGAAVAVTTFLTIMKYITVEQSVAIMGALAAFGFAVSKDANVTGGTVDNGKTPPAK